MIRIQPLNKGRTKSWKFDGHAEQDQIYEEVQEKRLSQVKERPMDLAAGRDKNQKRHQVEHSLPQSFGSARPPSS